MASVDMPTTDSTDSHLGAIGTLAFGSLISDPGVEIGPLIVARIETQTPFPVEYARLSATRGGSPTAVPHSSGCPVKAQVLRLADTVSLAEARNLLWRRETRTEGSRSAYRIRKAPNAVLVRTLQDCCGLKHVVYVDFNPEGKIAVPTPDLLATAAINSVATAEVGKDGISYLLGLRQSGVETTMTPLYVAEILARTGAVDLVDALGRLRSARHSDA